jgi:hypothetical protein
MTARILSIVFAFMLVGTAFAEAPKIEKEKANPMFAGRIMLSDKYYPRSAKSLTAFNAQVKKQSKENFFEDKDKKGTWKIYFAGFLKTPLNDVEYLVKIYDITSGKQQLLVSFEQFTESRGQFSLLSNMTLDKKTVGVNKQLLLTLESKGKILATTRFKVLGEGEKYSGKVNFSEDEAKGKKNDDDE